MKKKQITNETYGIHLRAAVTLFFGFGFAKFIFKIYVKNKIASK